MTIEANTVDIRDTETGKVYFSAAELGSPDTGEVRLAYRFADHLLELRQRFGLPMTVNSCCRTPVHNEAVGGGEKSFHLTEGNASDGTAAIDIRIPSGSYAAMLASKALNRGWTVLLYPTFMHLDRRYDFGQAPMLLHCE